MNLIGGRVAVGLIVTVFSVGLPPLVRGGAPCCPQAGTVLMRSVISDAAGGFEGVLDNNDQFGRAVASLGDVDGDGVDDLAVGAVLDDDGGADRGAVWVLFMNSDGSVRAEQKISSTDGGFSGALDNGDRFAMSVAGLGDLDGDGVVDLAVGARGDDDGGTNRGAVWVLFLNSDGTVRGHQKISSLFGGFTGVLRTGDGFGSSLAAMGDLDGDGRSELAVGVILYDDGGLDRGAVWVLFLNADGTVRAEQKISSTDGGFGGPLANGDQFGTSVAALGDVDGDGVRDLAVGAAFDDAGGTDRGAVWLLFMNANGTVKSHRKVSGAVDSLGALLRDGDQFGSSVARLRDLERNGFVHLAVGAIGDDDGGANRGALWSVFLGADGTLRGQQKISGAAGGMDGVLADGDGFGVAMVAMGDADGDGVQEVAVGAHLDDDGGTDRGAVWVLSMGGCASRPGCCEGDSDGGGDVNFADITECLTFFGGVGSVGLVNGGDATCDCLTNFADLTAVLTNFGFVCP
ncbi:MAG: FG-GAP repeat protein [Phycisphaerae bacterium]|nr:FG-GAP repeat protein [Phycisphaerae bacterium]